MVLVGSSSCTGCDVTRSDPFGISRTVNLIWATIVPAPTTKLQQLEQIQKMALDNSPLQITLDNSPLQINSPTFTCVLLPGFSWRTGYGCKRSWLTHSTNPKRARFSSKALTSHQGMLLKKTDPRDRARTVKNYKPCSEWHNWEFLTNLAEYKPGCFHFQVIVLVDSSFVYCRLLFVKHLWLQVQVHNVSKTINI